MLRESGNLRVNGCDGSAEHALKPNASSVALKGSENKSISHGINVACGFCICERLISCCLVQTIGVGNFPLSVC